MGINYGFYQIPDPIFNARKAEAIQRRGGLAKPSASDSGGKPWPFWRRTGNIPPIVDTRLDQAENPKSGLSDLKRTHLDERRAHVYTGGSIPPTNNMFGVTIPRVHTKPGPVLNNIVNAQATNAAFKGSLNAPWKKVNT